MRNQSGTKQEPQLFSPTEHPLPTNHLGGIVERCESPLVVGDKGMQESILNLKEIENARTLVIIH